MLMFLRKRLKKNIKITGINPDVYLTAPSGGAKVIELI